MAKKIVKKKAKPKVLKKVSKKQKHQMRQISSRKMTTIFVTGLIGFGLLSTTAIGLNVYGQMSGKNQPKVEKVSSDKVDYRLEQFLDGYVSAYFTYSLDNESQKKQLEMLNSYYNYVPSEQNQGQLRQETSLMSSYLQEIKDNVAVYEVVYKSGLGDSAENIKVGFNVPFGGKDGKYYVSGLPWFTAVTNLKKSKSDDKELILSSQTTDISNSDKKKLNDFMDLFFKNYTTSQKNLDLIADGVTTINGAIYKSTDWAYYKIHKNGSVDAYVQATFEIKGVTHSENFSFKLDKKKDSYFVKELKHEIPVDYAKVEKEDKSK